MGYLFLSLSLSMMVMKIWLSGSQMRICVTLSCVFSVVPTYGLPTNSRTELNVLWEQGECRK